MPKSRKKIVPSNHSRFPGCGSAWKNP